MGAFKILRGRATTSPPTVSVLFGEYNTVGLGGFPTSETPSSALGGAHAANWAIDDLGHIVPANLGVASGASYDTIWTGRTTASQTVTGASGTVYNLTVAPNTAYIRTRNGAPSNADDGAVANSTQLLRIFHRGTAAGGLPRGAFVIWRDGSHYNPNNTLWYFDPVAAASFTGTGRITITSETIETGLDANNNPIEGGSAKMGTVYFAGTAANTYPIDFKYINFYCNKPVPDSRSFVSYGNDCDGFGFYHCRVEYGSLVDHSLADNLGLNLHGKSEVHYCHFFNTGNRAALGLRTFDLTGPANATHNIVDSPVEDNFTFNGDDISFDDNFFFNLISSVGFHQDGIQFGGNLVSGSNDRNLANFRRNIMVRDRNNVSGGAVNALMYFSDMIAGVLTVGEVRNNINYTGTAMSLGYTRASAPVAQGNTFLVDPLSNPGWANSGIVIQAAGTNGSTFNYNHTNKIDTALQAGTNVSTPKALSSVTSLTIAQAQALYQTNYPLLPTTQNDPAWNNRASVLQIFTPLNRQTSVGGVMNADMTCNGALFPAVAPATTGAWNDLSVYDPLNPTWVADHPPAT